MGLKKGTGRLSRARHSSIRTRFLLGFVCLSIMVCLIFLVYFYIYAREQIIQNVGNSQTLRVQDATRIVDAEMSEVNNFLYWLITNEDLKSLLTAEDPLLLPHSAHMQKLYGELNSIHLYSQAKKRINLLYIKGKNGLTLRYGLNAYNMDPEWMFEDDWYRQSQSSNGAILWFPAIHNYSLVPLMSTMSRPSTYVVPVFKYIKYGTSDDIFGEIILLLDSQMFIYGEADGALDMMIDEKGTVIAANDFSYVGRNLASEAFYPGSRDSSGGTLRAALDGVPSLITVSPNMQGNRMISALSISSITDAQSTLLRSYGLCLIIVVVFVFVMSMYLSANFTRPIQAVVQRIEDISHGVFHQSPMELPTWNVDEILYLSHRLDVMEQNIQQLINERVIREQEKRELEIQMLQSQISPHFLNNTISSIRMMATMQGSQGIARMLDSLSVILSTVLRKSDDGVSLRDELSVVDAYIFIQRIRYHGRIRYELCLEDPSLLDCKIMRFTLQPLIENAIFHGLVPKNDFGQIILTIERLGETVRLTVSDNGVGISEKARRLLSADEPPREHDSLHGFGLRNVDRRLKLVYGECYGLSILKEANPTQIAITIPLQRIQTRKEADDESADRR